MKKNYTSPEVTEYTLLSGDIIMASCEDTIIDASVLWKS